MDTATGITHREGGESLRWFTVIAVFGLVIVAVYILAAIPGEHFTAACMAWLVLCVGLFSVHRLLGSKSLAALLPLVYIAKTSLSWGLAPAYMMGSSSGGSFITRHHTYLSIYKNSSHTMSVAFAFIIIYCSLILLFLRAIPARQSDHLLSLPKRSAIWATVLIIGIIAIHAVSLVISPPEIATYLTAGSRTYLIGIASIAGASFHLLPASVRAYSLTLFLFATGIYTLSNSRNYVLVPVVLFFLGFITRQDIRSKIKLIATTSITVAGLFYLLLANTTRLILGSDGFEEDSIGDRAAALSRWRDVFTDQSVLDNALGRINFSAGWVAISQTPDSIGYINFNLYDYLTEWARVVFVFGSGRSGNYTGNSFLHAYGYRVREGVGIEPSMVAACWVLGGWLPVIAGAIALAIFHGLVMLVITSIARRDRILAAFMTAAGLSAFLYGPTWGLIDHSRDVILYSLGAAVVYFIVIRPLIPIQERVEAQYDAISSRR